MARITHARRLPAWGAALGALALAAAGTGTARAASGAAPPHVAGYGSASAVGPARFAAMLRGRRVRIVTPARSRSGIVEKTVAAKAVASNPASPAIVGGGPVGPGTGLPVAQVLIALPNPGEPGTITWQFCAGTIISATRVATAASCVAGRTFVGNPDALVWAGSTSDILADIENGHAPASGIGEPVIQQWVSPGYRAASDGIAADDVAVLTTAGPLTVDGNGVAAPLAGDDADDAPGTTAEVEGWGATSAGQDWTGNPLEGATISRLPDSACSSAYPGYTAGDMTCFGTPAGSSAGAALCAADAGDPLLRDGTLIGIASAGAESCRAGSPNVFAAVSAHYGPLADLASAGSLMDGSGAISGLGAMGARDSQGNLWIYSGDGRGGVAARDTADFSFPATSLLAQSDLTGSGVSGVVARSSSGELSYTGFTAQGAYVGRQIGGGWNEYDTIVPLGNVGGARFGDLVARDASGELWLYPGRGDGTFAGRLPVGGGWNVYNAIVGNGDVDGDGYADLIARDAAGNLWFYRGTGDLAAPFAPRVRIGHGFQTYDALSVIDDYTGNGRAALVGRDAAGDLYAYQGTGSAVSPITARTRIGHGFGGYTSLF